MAITDKKYKRFPIPVMDTTTLNWMEAQIDWPVSLRMLISNDVKQNGYSDVLCRRQGQLINESVQQWMNAQSDLFLSIQALILKDIKDNDYKDVRQVLNKTETQAVKQPSDDDKEIAAVNKEEIEPPLPVRQQTEELIVKEETAEEKPRFSKLIDSL